MSKFLANAAVALVLTAAGAYLAQAQEAATSAAAAWGADRAKANIEGAKEEKTVVDKGLKAATGVSMKAIREHGWRGGPNSVINRPFGNLF
jgi:hypothetical protein